MATGRDPGWFGFTDVSRRPAGGYGPFKPVDTRVVPVPTLSGLLAAEGLHAIAVGLPGCSPPAGVEPDPVDVPVDGGFGPDELAARLLELDARRFDLALELMRTRPWDLLFVVCPAGDRVGQAFIRRRETMLEHYRLCDRWLGELVETAGPDTAVLVVSDHGMQPLDGTVLLNEWLADHGYLALEAPAGSTPLAQARVDWSRTRAWARGYGGQIFFNVRGRDLLGCVEPARVDDLADDLVTGLRELPGPSGAPLDVAAFRGDDLYSGPLAAHCPDLCVQFDSLRHVSSDRVGTVHRSFVIPGGEVGAGGAAHAPFGFLALAGPGIPAAGRLEPMHVLDVAPTVLDLLGLEHGELTGRALGASAPSRLSLRG